MFVAVYESLLHIRLDGIIRSPQNRNDYAHNAQILINDLSAKIDVDLQHITGKAISEGDVTSLSNVVDILHRIASIRYLS